MKKLLSICFLSILLGLLSFSTQAQSNCYGFWMENLDPDVLEQVANCGDMTGTYALNHTLGHAVLVGQSNHYVGNVGATALGQTELYELHFCDTASGKKLSFDWQLERRNPATGNWEIVNENLSAYADLGIYTLYPELNQAGQCQSIKWLGGLVADGFGFCEQQNPTLLDQIHGVTGCNTPTNYPGALQAQAGTLPGSVVNVLGQTTSAMGMTPIYSQGYDYFYADFLASTRTIVTINWKQVGDYRLVMRVRERVGGTDWTNTTWNKYGYENPLNETAYIGGHMSCCGPVLISDTLQYPVFDTLNMEVCMGTEVEMGSPYTYIFGATHRNIIDTTLLIGQFVNQGCACEYIDIDIIRNVNFYLRHVPVATADDATLCKCDAFTVDSLIALVHPDLEGLDETASTYAIQWWNGVNKWVSTPNFPAHNAVGTREYIIRQVNTYNDTLICEGPADTFSVTFLEVQTPELTIPEKLDYCLEEIDGNLMLHAVSDPDDHCANTTRWYTQLKSSMYYGWIENYPNYRTLTNIKTSSLLANQGNDLLVNLADYMPSTNMDTVIYFFATSYNDVTNCESPVFAYFKVNLHQTPKLVATPMDSMYCPGSEVTMEVTVANNPFDVDPQFHYYWIGEPTAVTIGNGTTTSGWMPLYSTKKYSYSQQIVTKNEISAGSITSMSLGVASNATTRNLSIYLSTTNLSNFDNAWDTADNKVLVYNGDVEFEEGWNDITFSTPFIYNGTENLLVTIVDNTAEKASKAINFNTTTINSIRARRTFNDDTPYALNYKGYGSNETYRANMRFTVAPSEVTTDITSTYTQPLAVKCNTAYTTTVVVVDGNNCTSAPVAFHYFTGDTVAPVIAPAAVSYGINACEITAQNVPAYTTYEAVVAAFNLNITDNCGDEYVTLVGYSDNKTTDSCSQTLVRTYTFKDTCGNPATFTQTVVSRDSVAPYFTFERPIRLLPIPAGDCKFNAPARQVLIDAIAPYVADNCTDSAFLMDGITFLWENTDLDPASDTNIFRLKNHLTITATITDKCGNSFTDVVFFLDRPADLEIVGHPVTSSGNVCEEQTAELYFDMTSIVDDQEVGPFPPYTLTWYEVNGKNVTFSDIHSDTTTVTFNEGPGDYTFAMRVVNGNDCEAVSAPATVNVRELPSLSIIPIVQNGTDEPYCPTYGNLTIEAVVANAETSGATSYNYTWSGESVNIYSTTKTTWITIIPEWCDTTYTATVVVADERGCTAEISRTFAAAAHEMIFNGIVPDSTVNILQGCELRVPDYSALISAANITDDCYTFSQITAKSGWYKQTPAANTLFDADQVEVTITITNPCGQTVTTTTHALKPANYPSVTIVPADTALCYNDIFAGVQYNTIGTNLDAATTWAWTIANDTIGTDDNLLIPNNVFTAPVNKDTTYVVKVNAVNGLGCPASATANLTVYYQGDSVQLRVWNNNLCGEDHYNGVIAVDFVPTNYVVTLSQGEVDLKVKISDNNQHEQTDWNTVIFDSLAPGYYTITVENLHGCTMSADTVVRTDGVDIPEPTVTVTDVTVCTNDNGIITVARENNYSFALFNPGHSVEYTGVVSGANIVFSGLSVGQYDLVKTHIPTGCSLTFVDTVNDASTPETHFNVNVTNNTHCTEPNGTLTFTVNGSDPMTLHVWTENGTFNYTTGPITTDTTINGLGSIYGNVLYRYEVTNTVTECKSAILPVVVQLKAVHPEFTATPSNNTICPNNTAYNNNAENLVNGKITISPANDYTYTVVNSNNDTVTNSLNALAADSYKVIALNTNNQCTTTVQPVVVGNTYTYPVVDAISQTPNSVCDLAYAQQYDGSLTIKVKANPTSGYSYIKPYMIVLNNDTVIAQTSNQQNTIPHLQDGTYNYYILANNRCYVTGEYEVEKYVIDTMRLTSTPDHFCAPTFEKPGDGTIVVLSPRNSANHGYKYKFYDVDSTDMTVPYEMPMTYTKYWLAAGTYTVFAIDTVTGCTFTKDTVVDKDLYTITIGVTTTASTYCSTTSGDGSITVNATSNNPDAVFNYSLDKQNWQVSNVFTDLANTDYMVYVKDIDTRCVDSIEVGISYSDCRPDITIVDQAGNGAPFEYCIDDENLQLCATASYATGSECEGTFSYHWYAPCSDPNSSDENCIDVVPEHVMANGCLYKLTVTNQLTGCSYDTTVTVIINAKPVIGFAVTANGQTNTYYNPEQSIPFCEETPLHIAVVCQNGQTLVPEQTYWTLGHSGTGLSFDTTGVNYPDYTTICAYSTSDKGCVSKIASLPLNFYRVDTVSVDVTSCTRFQIPLTNRYISNPTGVYPYDTTVAHTYSRPAPKCDSVVLYNIRFISTPEITPNPVTVAAFCEDMNYTLADFVDSFTVKENGATTTLFWQANGVNVDASTVVDYDFARNYSNVRYCATNACSNPNNLTSARIYFTVSKAPEITNFQVASKYCRGQQASISYSYKTYRPSITVLTIGGDTVAQYTTTDTYLYNIPRTFNRTFTFTPNHANYDGKTIALSVRNLSDLCDVDTRTATLTVDTNIKHLATLTKEYCEGEAISSTTFLPNLEDYDIVGMNIKYNGATTFTTIQDGAEVTYPAMNGAKLFFTLVDNVCSLNIVTDTATITVKPLPNVALNGGNFNNVCKDVAFMPSVVKTPDGIQNFIDNDEQGAEGWLMWSAADQAYVSTDTNAIKAAAADHNVYFRYFVKTNCGTDTTGVYTAHLNDAPDIADFANTTINVCRNNTIGSKLPTISVTWHNTVALPDHYQYIYYRLVNGNNVTDVTYNSVFDDYMAFNDGKLRVVVVNECGADSTEVNFHIYEYDYTDIVAVDTCKGLTIADFATAPQWTGDNVVVAGSGTWMYLNNNTNVFVANDGSYVVNESTEIKYRWRTICNEYVYTEPVTLTPKLTPTVQITASNLENGVISICEGSTINVSANIFYAQPSATVLDTVWTFNGVNYDPSYQFTANDNNKKLYVKIITTCDESMDSILIRVYPTPTVSISGPLTSCSGEDVTFTAEPNNFSTYVFTINGQATPAQTSNVYTTTVYDNNPNGVDITTAKVTVTDAHQCTATSANQVEVSVTDQAAFIFFNADSTENVAHEYTVDNGLGLNYGWTISTECSDYDTLVYVEYDIYYEGHLISNEAIGEFFNTVNVTDDYGQVHPYISTTTFTWLSGNGTPLSNTALYNYAVSNPSTATSGNHFPNTNLGFSHNAVYDDLWLRFIGDRYVNATFVPFRMDGEYKVVYRLYATSHADDFEDVYTEDNIDHSNYGGQSHIGGQNSLINGTSVNPVIRTLLAIDSITIHVSNAVAEPVADFVAPELAPAINTQEAVIVPEMEVWPNPAPSIVTTFKARVYNMSGEATVTITNFQGKQVYNGNINIDSDNFYFEADVNSLAVGAYIMTVRTNDAVVTKKLVVTVRQ